MIFRFDVLELWYIELNLTDGLQEELINCRLLEDILGSLLILQLILKILLSVIIVDD